MRVRHYIALLLASILLVVSGCAAAPSPAPVPSSAMPVLPPSAAAVAPFLTPEQYPVVDGSTATIPLGIALMQAATGMDLTHAEEQVVHNGTSDSYFNLQEGKADLLIVYAPPEDTYQQVFGEDESKYIMAPIGRDALVFLLSEQNPVDSLTQQQLVEIYSGSTTNWKDVGGEDAPIAAYQRNEDSGSQTLMRKLCMKDVPMMQPPATQVVMGMGELIDRLMDFSGESDAIGYSVYYYAQNMYERPGLKLLSVDGHQPDNQTIASGDYPYVNDFYCVIRSDTPEGSPAWRLYQFLIGEQGQSLVQQCGYVPVS